MTARPNPFPVPLPDSFDYNKQSITRPNPKSGETPLYLLSAFPDLPQAGSKPVFPSTAYDCFNLGLSTRATSPCLGRRPWDDAKGDWAGEYVWETYEQVDQKRGVIGSALKEVAKQGLLGQGIEANFKVGVWCVNRPEWQYVSLATAAHTLTLVSLYDTLGPNVVEFCINHSEVRIVFAAPEHIGALLKLAKQCPTLKVIVSVDDFKGRFAGQGKVYREWAANEGIKLFDLAEFIKLGQEHPHSHSPPKGEDMASICYTSGTTGNPKGAILSHANLASAAVGNLHGSTQNSESVFFSYLPLSHIYGRFCEDVAFTCGCAIGFTCGDNLRLLEDMQILKPTHFVSVPRVLNRVYHALKAATIDAPGLKGKLLRKVFDDKTANLKAKGVVTHGFYDRVLLKKVRAALGGRVEFISSGSAPIAPEVLAFLKVAFSCEVTEGYGQTENCGTALRCVSGENSPDGTCGPPQAGVLVKLIDVPEMQYLSTDNPPRGELCTKGGVVISAYYKDEVKSKETVDEDGWLHSGDVASVDAKGRFKIIDRVKNLVKLSQGEYVALEKIENIYALCPLIAQIFIYADSLRDHVVAVIVPDPEKFAGLLHKELGVQCSPSDVAGLANRANDPKIIAALAKDLQGYADAARLNGFERINSDIHVSLEPFTMENDLLTPTMKTKRNLAAKVYKKELDRLYATSKKSQKQYAKL